MYIFTPDRGRQKGSGAKYSKLFFVAFNIFVYLLENLMMLTKDL